MRPACTFQKLNSVTRGSRIIIRKTSSNFENTSEIYPNFTRESICDNYLPVYNIVKYAKFMEFPWTTQLVRNHSSIKKFW